VKTTPSAVALFEACPRAWFYRYVEDIHPPKTKRNERGERAHDAVRRWYIDGTTPDDALGLLAVRSGWLPTSNAHPEVKFDLPRQWGVLKGRMDVAAPSLVVDLKSVRSFRYQKTPEGLRNDPQMRCYALAQAEPRRPVTIRHIYLRTEGAPAVTQTEATFTPEEILHIGDWLDEVATLQWETHCVNRLPPPLQGAPLTPACKAYGGCFFAPQCLGNPNPFEKGKTTMNPYSYVPQPTPPAPTPNPLVEELVGLPLEPRDFNPPDAPPNAPIRKGDKPMTKVKGVGQGLADELASTMGIDSTPTIAQAVAYIHAHPATLERGLHKVKGLSQAKLDLLVAALGDETPALLPTQPTQTTPPVVQPDERTPWNPTNHSAGDPPPPFERESPTTIVQHLNTDRAQLAALAERPEVTPKVDACCKALEENSSRNFLAPHVDAVISVFKEMRIQTNASDKIALELTHLVLALAGALT